MPEVAKPRGSDPVPRASQAAARLPWVRSTSEGGTEHSTWPSEGAHSAGWFGELPHVRSQTKFELHDRSRVTKGRVIAVSPQLRA